MATEEEIELLLTKVESQFELIVDRALEKQRKDIFGKMSEIVGYDLGDKEEVRELQKTIRFSTGARKKSEQIGAIGFKMFVVFIIGAVMTAFVAGFKEEFTRWLGNGGS